MTEKRQRDNKGLHKHELTAAIAQLEHDDLAEVHKELQSVTDIIQAAFCGGVGYMTALDRINLACEVMAFLDK